MDQGLGQNRQKVEAQLSISAECSVVRLKREAYNAHTGEKTMRTRICLLMIILTAAVSTFAADAPTSTPSETAAAAFTRLRSLVGEWQAETKMGKIIDRYELVSNGHVLLEHTSVAGMHENMVTTYYLDGDKLALTHYCDLGNLPRMQARRIDLNKGEIQFDFVGAANLASPQAKHMHSAVIHLVDANHFASDWTLFENAQPTMTVSAQYIRVR